MKLKRGLVILVLIITVVACKQHSYTVKSCEGTNIAIDSTIHTDSAMEANIAPYRKDLDIKMNKVIGFSEKVLTGYKPESSLSNFVSDVIQKQAYNYLLDHKMDSLQLFTLMNVKGLRASMPQGDIMVRNIFEVMPFENEIVILYLPGDSILSLFDFLGITDGDGISNASAKYAGTKTMEVLIGGESIDASKNYFLATSDYLANGGDHYHMIMQPKARYEIGVKLREAIIENIEESQKVGDKISAKIEGRIIFN